jgi:imidazolonepropionase-like amidohydrolase
MSHSDSLTLDHCHVLDADSGELAESMSIRISDGHIQEIGSRVSAGNSDRVDLRGHVVMPGLIDAHVHVMASDLKLSSLVHRSSTLLAAQSAPIMRDMIMRGFTSVRDAGGADWGLAEAVRRGYFVGPRLFIAGRGIAQTGGQGDFREIEEVALPDYCAHALGPMARVADGADAIRAAVREELRRGADQIKIFAGGGVAGGISLDHSHFTVDEIRAACEEANAAGTYVMAHAYAADSILRAVEAGARTIEHGNMINDEVAQKISGRAYLVPTLSALDGRLKHADELGFTDQVRHTMRSAIQQGLAGIESCARAGVPVGFGTDLEGIILPYQYSEFDIRSEVQTSVELIRSATVVNAEILNMSGRLGVVAEGAFADLLIVDGNPSEDFRILQDPSRLCGIMKAGEFVSNLL